MVTVNISQTNPRQVGPSTALQAILKTQHRLLTRVEEVELARQVQRGNLTARDRLIQANTRLVIAIAKRYQHWNIPVEDLIQEGTLGLARAVDKFEPDQGYRLSTYAYQWIKSSILHVIREKSRIIRLPSHLLHKVSQVKKFAGQYRAKYGSSPPASELKAFVEQTLAWNWQTYQDVVAQSQTISLNYLAGGEQGSQLLDRLINPAPMPALNDCHLVLGELLTSARLTQREWEVLQLRYYDDLTLQQISCQLDCSRERIWKVEKKALQKLKQTAHNLGLREDILAILM